jgi:hypothetical protein
MKYLDYEKLENFRGQEFRQRKPYPWTNPQGILTEDGFQRLVSHLPDISLFEKSVGYERRFGQQAHDKYALHYDSNLPIDAAWHEFIQELQEVPYRNFLRKLYGLRPMKLSFHWHWSESGNSVSPHCDSRSKIGSHIFYLNTDDDWKAEWGGQTLVLNDHGKLSWKSAPEFSDFEEPAVADAIGNRSMLFKRTPHSWHGVKAIDCPKGKFRKVFIVVIERVRPVKELRNFLNGL